MAAIGPIADGRLRAGEPSRADVRVDRREGAMTHKALMTVALIRLSALRKP
jgi:hypothetical protein